LHCCGGSWDTVIEPRASLKDIDPASVRQFQQLAKGEKMPKEFFELALKELNAAVVLLQEQKI